MSWDDVGGRGASRFFDFVPNKWQKIRVLDSMPLCLIVHNIPATIEGSEPSRAYRTTVQRVLGAAKNKQLKAWKGNDNVSGLMKTKDPLWKSLKKRDKYGRTDGKTDIKKKVHFPCSVTYQINVWNYGEEKVQVLRGGNMLFEKLKEIAEATEDITSVDIKVKKTTGRLPINTKYSAQNVGEGDFDVEEEDLEERMNFSDMVKMNILDDADVYVKGGDPEEDEGDEDDDEKPARKKGKKGKKGGWPGGDDEDENGADDDENGADGDEDSGGDDNGDGEEADAGDGETATSEVKFSLGMAVVFKRKKENVRGVVTAIDHDQEEVSVEYEGRTYTKDFDDVNPHMDNTKASATADEGGVDLGEPVGDNDGPSYKSQSKADLARQLQKRLTEKDWSVDELKEFMKKVTLKDLKDDFGKLKSWKKGHLVTGLENLDELDD